MTEVTVTSKVCTTCALDKPLDQFSSVKPGLGKHGRAAKCKACKRAYAADRLSDPVHRERKRKQERDRRANDPEYRAKRNVQSLEINTKRYAEDEEYRAKALAFAKQHQVENPHIAWKKTAIYRLKQFGFTPVAEDFTRDDVVRVYGDACFYCGGEFVELDHFVPLIAGGPHTLANARPCCVGCNRSKRAQDGDVFVAAMLD